MLISPRFLTEQLSWFYQLFINVIMKLLIAFSLVIVLISFQEKMSCFYISVPDSPGYNQDGDFLIGGFFSLRVTGREDRTEFCFNETMNMTYGSYL
jgi:vomeronasal 2 receptor